MILDPQYQILVDRIKDLESRCSSYALVLGMAHGAIMDFLWDPSIANCVKDKMRRQNEVISDKINELFYKGDRDDKKRNGAVPCEHV